MTDQGRGPNSSAEPFIYTEPVEKPSLRRDLEGGFREIHTDYQRRIELLTTECLDRYGIKKPDLPISVGLDTRLSDGFELDQQRTEVLTNLKNAWTHFSKYGGLGDANAIIRRHFEEPLDTCVSDEERCILVRKLLDEMSIGPEYTGDIRVTQITQEDYRPYYRLDLLVQPED